MPSSSPARGRLAPIDWMRGLVMVLMTIDHSSGAFNQGRSFTDAAWAWKPGTALDSAQYLTRWITHLCAPTFVFLAGASLALMATRRARAGEPQAEIDRQMVIRGLFIAALDPLWMSLAFFGWQRFILQVLYAIGLAMICMAALRRLPPWLLGGLGLAFIVGVDLVFSAAFEGAGSGGGRPPAPLPVGLLVAGGPYGPVIVAYPLASWLGIMMLGWVFGRWLIDRGDRSPAPLLAVAGVLSLGAFALLRGIDRWGNMALHRDDSSILQWLHVAKYPPSVTFVTLELGIMALLLALFFVVARQGEPLVLRPLRVLGSSAMLYYLLHAHLLVVASYALGLHGEAGLRETYIGAALCVAALYWPCVLYSRYKAGHSNWVTRLI